MEAINAVNAALWHPGEQVQKSQTDRQTKRLIPRVAPWVIIQVDFNFTHVYAYKCHLVEGILGSKLKDFQRPTQLSEVVVKFPEFKDNSKKFMKIYKNVS